MLQIHTEAFRTIAAVIVLLTAGHAHLAGAQPLKVGYFNVPPHAMPGPADRPQGVAVAYFDLIAREMQVSDIEFVLLPLNRLLLELENNRVDMALLLARNAERAAKFVYPAEAYCMTKPSIAVSAEIPLKKVRSVADILLLSFHETPGNYRSEIMQDQRLNIQPLAGEDFTRRCYAMILNGRIDACYQPDHYPIQYEAMREAFAARIKVLYLPDPPIGLYSAFSRIAALTYLKRYEAALAKVKQQHSYGVVFEKFMAQ